MMTNNENEYWHMLAVSYLQDGQKHRAIEQRRAVAVMQPSYPSRDFPIDEAKRMLERNNDG
jgi:hypothetical protein